MPPKKKKAKAPANPARGFATTSTPSKPRVEASEPTGTPQRATNSQDTAKSKEGEPASQAGSVETTSNPAVVVPQLSPEEFERQLEESELQLLVEKYGQETRRGALRQQARLETDRRVLRPQAEPINVYKWLPPEILDQVLELIRAESRYASAAFASDGPMNAKLPQEEELTMRLWTLQQTLVLLGFQPHRVDGAVRYILAVSPTITSANKDSIWALEEALDWMARECNASELRYSDHRPQAPKIGGRSITSPLASAIAWHLANRSSKMPRVETGCPQP